MPISRILRDLLPIAGLAGLLGLCLSAGTASADKPHIPASSHPVRYEFSPLPDFTYECGDGTCHRDDFMRRVGVCALLVLKGDRALVHYNPDLYACPEGEGRVPSANNGERRYGIASVTKSITSTLLGFALMKTPGDASEGIDAAKLQMPISELLSGLSAGQSKAAYAGVPVDRVLRMRSGAKYGEYGADARRLRAEVFGAHAISALDFLRQLRRKSHFLSRPIGPGEGAFSYAGADTQAIGLLVEQLAGTRLIGYLRAKLWEPLGMTKSAKWTVDWQRSAAAYCCLAVTAPDLLRFGQFVRDRGRIGSAQMLPGEWFDLATKSPSPEDDEIPEDNVSYNGECRDAAPTHYRYQWWLFKDRTDFTAVGINGQYVHIYPDQDLVIVQLSAWPHWRDALACESMDAHAAIVDMLD